MGRKMGAVVDDQMNGVGEMDAITPLARQRDPPESTWNTIIATPKRLRVTIQAIPCARGIKRCEKGRLLPPA